MPYEYLDEEKIKEAFARIKIGASLKGHSQ